MNDTRISQAVYSLKNTIIFGVGTTLYVFLMAVIYTPTFGYDDVSAWHAHSALTIPVVCVIVAAVLAVTRMLLLLLTRRSRLHISEYLLWQVGEVAAISLFVDLFISLYYHLNYFAMLHVSLLVSAAILVVPYVVYWLYIALLESNRQLAEAREDLVVMQSRSAIDERNQVRFADEKGIVRLVVSASKVIAVESAGNYVTIIHDGGGHATRFSLRSSLKAMEQQCEGAGLVRCHRSYYVNLSRIKLLRKDTDSLYAEVDAEGVADVPVSKTYSAEVVRRFSQQ